MSISVRKAKLQITDGTYLINEKNFISSYLGYIQISDFRVNNLEYNNEDPAFLITSQGELNITNS